MSYDENARRDTPLALKLKERIRKNGPIDVGQYMDACLNDPQHGYYLTQQAIGASGDFVTAPEISQVFGELIGLWCAVVWQQLDMPPKLNLVELGPGRGTLMADALRAAGKVPGFFDALDVHLVESNRELGATQRQLLAKMGAGVRWIKSWPLAVKECTPEQSELFRKLEAKHGDETPWPLPIPEGPAVIIGNEFIDVLPIRQLVFADGAWHHRRVGLASDGQFEFMAGPPATIELPGGLTSGAAAGAVYSVPFSYREIIRGLVGARAKRGPVAALFIDYGHVEPGLGDTVQAVRRHKYESVFASPGEADLTAQVDFAAIGREAADAGLAVDGPITQAEFLGRLGIIERASKLMAANQAMAGEIEAGVMRLMAPNGMGTRFKAIGIRSPGLPALPGF